MPYRNIQRVSDTIGELRTLLCDFPAEDVLAELVAERARLEAVLDQMPSGVIIAAAPSGQLLLGNRQVEHIWRHPFLAAAAVGEYDQYRGFHPDGRPLRPEDWPLARSIQHGEVIDFEEIDILRGDGTRGTIELRSAPITNDDGDIVAGVVIFTDVSKSKQAHDRLAALYAITASLSRAVTRGDIVDVIIQQGVAVIGARQAGVAVVSDDGAALNVVGALGYPPDMLEAWRRIPLSTPIPLTEAVRRGEPLWYDSREELLARYPVLTDAVLPSTTAFAAIPFIVGQRAIGVLGISFSDAQAPGEDERAFAEAIAEKCAQALERSRLYEVEQKAREAAEQAVSERERFLATAAHELKTPLTSIKAIGQMVARHLTDATPRQARLIEQLNGQINRLEALISDLLDVSRIQRGRLDLKREPVDLVGVVRESLHRFDDDADSANGQRFVIEGREPVTGMWDRHRLDQVVTNLLSNAVKYSASDTTIRVTVHRDGEAAKLSVQDQGNGIPESELAHLFQPFNRSELSRTTVDGTGLGLYISRQIVELHGGSIDVVSQVGEGSTFTVTLPRER